MIEHDLATPRLVVGVGASAGGIDAFSKLLAGVPGDSGIAFVMVLHLAPTKESHLAGILEQVTSMPVAQVIDGARLEPDHVYVIAPATSLSVRDGALHVGEDEQPHYRARPIDGFLTSLAASYKQGAVGIVLSGTGDDGSAGLREIRAAGGLCLVQDPETAEHPGMPRSAVAAGTADAVVAVEEMGKILAAHVADPSVRPRPPQLAAAATPRQGLDAILSLLGDRYRVDFGDYKKGTLSRRTERRMGFKRIAGEREYLDYLREHPEEVAALYGDLLIDVTRFFRDPEEWQFFEQRVLPELWRTHDPSRPLRVWSAGCATGEEAYGLAIVLSEHLERIESPVKLQVFASDLSHDALAFARRGLYPASIEGAVSPDRLRRFFRPAGERFEVDRRLRDLVTFAAHNLLSDPPFAHLDLVSCRNVLIYLEPHAQQRLLEGFHFSLRPQGALWLGNAETTGRLDDLFGALSPSHRLYRSIAGAGAERHHVLRWMGRRAPTIAPSLEPVALQDGPKLARRIEQLVLHQHTPACAVIDRRLEIRHLFGPTDGYLSQPRGEARMDLLAWVRPGLYAKLRPALADAVERRRAVTVTGMRVERGATTASVTAEIAPITALPGVDSLFFVVFRDLAAPEPAVAPTEAGPGEAPPVGQLEQELRETQQELHAAVEQLKTATDEYHGSYEELLSLNEEFQSTNEELETSKEELQSLNEELTTINRQLEEKNSELRTLSVDLSNLLVSTNLPTVFLDRRLRIRRFTPACTEVMRIVTTDVGRPFDDIKLRVHDTRVIADAAGVLEELEATEVEVSTADGRWFSRRVLPYRAEDGRVDGVCVTFQDITAQKQAAVESEDARAYAENIIRTSRTPLLVLDAGLRVLSANDAFYATFHVAPEETLGCKVFELGNHQWEIPPLRRLLEEVLPQEQEVRNYDVDHAFERIGWRSMRLNADMLERAHGADRILVSIEDVTDLRKAEAAASRRADDLSRDHRRKDEFLAMLGHELRNPLGALTAGLSFVKRIGGVPERVGQVHEMMARQTRRLTAMLDELLDVSRIISGKLELASEAVDLAEACSAAIETVQPMIDAGGHELTVRLPAAGTALVLGDGLRLAQVVENLLANAAKYTDHGGRIWLTVDTTGDEVTLAVRDTGIGMEPDVLEHVFDLFTQAPSLLDRAKGGLGLGLALVRSLVEMHRGQVRAFSAGAGQGSELTVTLPRLRAGRVAPDREGSARPAAAASHRLLVVDDEVDAADVLAELLTLEGHQARAVHDGPAALEAARSFRPEIVLLDLGLPRMDGYEVARALRQEHGQHLLLVAMTGYQKDAARLEQAGFDHHVLKPPDMEKLAALLSAHDPGAARGPG